MVAAHKLLISNRVTRMTDRILFRDFLNLVQKKRGVHRISARNSGARNGCTNFMGARHFRVLSAGKPPCP